MILNRCEYLMMNNPLRAAVQRYFEAPRLRRLGGSVAGGKVLELGCGRGVGAELALDVFEAAHVDAFDLDPRMIERARKRHAPRATRVQLWVGDATAIPVADETYDAVFDFGIIHHVPAWREALREVRRVLKPGGRFFAEEVLTRFLDHPLIRRLFEHPREDRFDAAAFQAALTELGFVAIETRQLLQGFGWFVATKPAA